jgi:hypothetical protein
MFKSNNHSKINDAFKKKCKNLRKELSMLNLSEVSLKNKKHTSTNHINIVPNSEKKEIKVYNSSMKSINEKNGQSNDLFSLKLNFNSKNINNGIIHYNKIKIKIPRIFILRGNIGNNLTERKIYLSPIKYKSRITDKIYNKKRMQEWFHQVEEDKQKVNEILKLKDENNNLNKRKENEAFEQLLKKLSINKYNEDKVLKKIRVGMLDQKSYLKSKINNIKKRKLRNIKESFLNIRNTSLKYFEDKNKSCINMNAYNKYTKHNSSPIINNSGLDKKAETKEKNIDKIINHYKSMKIININKRMKLINEELKNIDNKFKDCFNKIREKFENDIQKELGD